MTHLGDDNASLDIHPRMPRERGIGIGCIGAGFIMADCHLVAYRQAGFNPVAIASRRPQRAREVAARHGIARCYDSYGELLGDPEVEVVDIAVPPDVLAPIVADVVKHAPRVRGILAQKPLGTSCAEARQIVEQCEAAGITLAVNQNMRYDQSVRACKSLLTRGMLGTPVLATIDMRAIPHWMPWQGRLGWVTLRIMSIHHLDTFRYWFGEPARVLASVHCIAWEGRLTDASSRGFLTADNFGEAIRRFLESTVALLESDVPFQVLAHIDYPKRYLPAGVPYDDRAFEEEFRTVLRAAAKRDSVLEINTTRGGAPGRYLSPGPNVVRWWREEGGGAISLGSDTHSPKHLAAGFEYARDVAEAAGFKAQDDPLAFWMP